jgi:hypothetical protein
LIEEADYRHSYSDESFASRSLLRST